MQRRFLGVIGALAITAAACTPTQQARFWSAVLEGHEAEARAAADEYGRIKEEATAGRPCEEWYDEAIEAGFTPEQWKEPVSRIMYRESHCNPSAKNPHSTAAGLMQELRMWADDCGGVYADLFDPVFNLTCAAQVIFPTQGWRAWSTY